MFHAESFENLQGLTVEKFAGSPVFALALFKEITLIMPISASIYWSPRLPVTAVAPTALVVVPTSASVLASGAAAGGGVGSHCGDI